MTLDVNTRPFGEESQSALPSEDRGFWMQTRYGRRFYLFDPRPEEVFLDDIAWALSRLCRFGGHVAVEHYSVAEHSVRASYICDKGNELLGLMHDSGEAFVADMITPCKAMFPEYKAMEKKVVAAIDKRFRFGGRLVDPPPDIKRADLTMLATEHRDLMADGPGHLNWSSLVYEPLPEKIIPWGAEEARLKFLARFVELTTVGK